MDDRLFENILKIDRNLLYFFFDKWYSTDFSVGHEEEPGKYEKKILYAIEIMLSYMGTAFYSKKEWSDYIEATPEQVRAIVVKQKNILAQQDRERREQEWLPRTLRYLSANPSLVLTIGYIYLTTFGLTYKWSLYYSFEVNLFEYAEAGDFLLAGLEQPSAMLNALVALITGLIIVFGNLRDLLRRMSPIGRKLHLTSIILGFVGWLMVPPFISGYILADEIEQGETRQVLIETSSENPCVKQAENLGLIGSAGSYTFLHNSEKGCTVAISTNKLESLEFITETAPSEDENE